MEEESVSPLQSRFISVLGQVVKTCRLGEQIDLQQFLLSMESFTEALEEGVPYDMMELFEFLHEQEVAKEDIDEVFLVFKTREEHIGVEIVLPIYVDALPDTEKEKVLVEYQERLDKAAAQPIQEAPPPAPEKQVKEVAQFDKVKKKKKKKSKALPILTVVVLACGGGFHYWEINTRPPAPKNIDAKPFALALPCAKLRTWSPQDGTPIAFCFVKQADYKKMKPKQFRRLAMVSKAQLNNRGYPRVMFKVLETNQILTVKEFGD